MLVVMAPISLSRDRHCVMEVVFARNLSLSDVEERFGLMEVDDAAWFREYQGQLQEPTASERAWLDQVRADFLAISKHPLHEEIVKMVVLAPLLSLAGLCRPPFLPVAEKSVEVSLEDRDETVRGRVDVLVLHQQLWVTTIEAKRKGLNVSEALPQALFYMLSNAADELPRYGLVTNGSHFIFIKLVAGAEPRYALSEEFGLRREPNELYGVLGILRRLGSLAVAQVAA